jgi:hypothetical protein
VVDTQADVVGCVADGRASGDGDGDGDGRDGARDRAGAAAPSRVGTGAS